MSIILDAITEANTAAGIKTLSFADLREFNSFVNSFTFLEYPVNVVVPFDVRTRFTMPQVQDTITLQGWVLMRIKQGTNDWRSPQLENDYIDPCRTLAKKFIRSILNNEFVDQSKDAEATFKREYMFLSAHLFGVSYQATVYGISGLC